MMAEVILSSGDVVHVLWNGKHFLINGVVVEVDDFTRAVFNYSSSESVFVRWVLDVFTAVDLDVVDIRGSFRHSQSSGQ